MYICSDTVANLLERLLNAVLPKKRRESSSSELKQTQFFFNVRLFHIKILMNIILYLVHGGILQKTPDKFLHWWCDLDGHWCKVLSLRLRWSSSFLLILFVHDRSMTRLWRSLTSHQPSRMCYGRTATITRESLLPMMTRRSTLISTRGRLSMVSFYKTCQM